MRKIVSIEENILEIDVAGQKYEIARLTLGAQHMATEYKVAAIELLQESQSFMAEIMNTDVKDERKLKAEIEKKSAQFKRDYEYAATKLEGMKLQVIEKILADNGYEYDNEFWSMLDHTLPDRFINEVLEKDTDTEGVKKGAVKS